MDEFVLRRQNQLCSSLTGGGGIINQNKKGTQEEGKKERKVFENIQIS